VRGAGTTPNVLALSLRATSSAELGEILDAWFSVQPSAEPGDAANIEHLRHIEQDPGDGRRNRPA
jgi:ribose 5-phosphate isomerase B